MALTFFSARYSCILKTSLFCCMTATPLWIILGLPTEIMALWWFTCWTQVSEIHIQALTVWFLTVIYFKFCHSGVEMETRKLSGKLKNVYMGSMWWSNTLSSFCNRNKDTILLASETRLSSQSAVMQDLKPTTVTNFMHLVIKKKYSSTGSQH